MYLLAVWLSVCLLCKNVYSVPLLILKSDVLFFLLLSYLSSLYILDIVCCSPMVTFACVDFDLESYPKVLPLLISRYLPSLFSSRSFIVSFKSYSQIFNPF